MHRGEGVQVGDEVERLLVVLQRDVLADRAEVVAPMRKRRWAGFRRERA